MVKIKRQESKRITCRKRYKIEKKVRAHNKEMRSAERKMKAKKANKLIQIPNICPFKESILDDVEKYKQHIEELKQKQREKWKEEARIFKENKERYLEEMRQAAERKEKEFNTCKSTGIAINKEKAYDVSSFKAYCKEFRKVVETADVILEVLDARDPLGTRCKQVEQAVLDSCGNKRLVLILNKADLVTRDNLEAWLKYLRRSLPTIPFKANTQLQKAHLGRRKIIIKNDKNHVLSVTENKELLGAKCFGAELLMSLLANYCRNKGIRTSIIVGVVGLPNVGKSSIINSLKRSRACNVGATPGVTKNMQVVQLDSKIQLLDSPGVVFASSYGGVMSEGVAALKNCVKVELISDPVSAAEAIIRRINKEKLREMYKVRFFKSIEEFLPILAMKKGYFKRKGIPNIETAATSIIEDWNRGRIRYFTVPPEDDFNPHISAEIVQQMAAEFDISSFQAMETETFDKKMKQLIKGLPVQTVGPVEEILTKVSEEEEPMEEVSAGIAELVSAEPIETSAEQKKDDLSGERIEEDLSAEPVEEDMSEEPIEEDLSGEPIEEDLSGEPIEEDLSGEPIEEDLSAEPIKEDLSAEPIKEDLSAEPIDEEKMKLEDGSRREILGKNVKVSTFETNKKRKRNVKKKKGKEVLDKMTKELMSILGNQKLNKNIKVEQKRLKKKKMKKMMKRTEEDNILSQKNLSSYMKNLATGEDYDFDNYFN